MQRADHATAMWLFMQPIKKLNHLQADHNILFENRSWKLGKRRKLRGGWWQPDDKQFPLKPHYEMDVMYHEGSCDVACWRQDGGWGLLVISALSLSSIGTGSSLWGESQRMGLKCCYHFWSSRVTASRGRAGLYRNPRLYLCLVTFKRDSTCRFTIISGAGLSFLAFTGSGLNLSNGAN